MAHRLWENVKTRFLLIEPTIILVNFLFSWYVTRIYFNTKVSISQSSTDKFLHCYFPCSKTNEKLRPLSIWKVTPTFKEQRRRRKKKKKRKLWVATACSTLVPAFITGRRFKHNIIFDRGTGPKVALFSKSCQGVGMATHSQMTKLCKEHICDTIKGNESHVGNVQFWVFNIIYLPISNPTLWSKPHYNPKSGSRDMSKSLNF